MLLFSAFTYSDVFVPSATFSQTITAVTSRVKKNKKVSLNQNATSAGQLVQRCVHSHTYKRSTVATLKAESEKLSLA